MLGALLLFASAQSTSCGVPGRIWAPVHEQRLELEDGTPFAKVGSRVENAVPVSPDLYARISEDGSADLRVESRGFVVAARGRVEVFSLQPLSFDDGFVTGRGTALKVISVRGSEALLVPAPRADLTRQREWTPQAVACDALRFTPSAEEPAPGGDADAPEKWLSEHTELRPSRGAPAAFVLEEGGYVQVRRVQLGQAQVSIKLGDGALLTAWVATSTLRGSRGSFESGAIWSAIGHRAARVRPPLTCRHRLPVYAVQGERSAKVGSLEPGWPFDAQGDGELSEIQPDESPGVMLLPGWHWAVPTVELRGCTRTP